MNERIKPAFTKNNIPIYLASSDLYAPYVGVVIESIIENSTPAHNYDILILQTDITEKNQKIILGLAEGKENISIRIIDVSEIMDTYEFQTINTAHKKYNFYRLTALELLKEYDKVIYLDSDLIVNTDLAELMGVQLGDNYLAATKCLRMSAHCNNPNVFSEMKLPMRQYLLEEVGLKNPDNYFNSGVMLLSLDNMRRDMSSQQLLEISARTALPTGEQNALNLLCEGKVVFLPLAWNYLSMRENGIEEYADKALYEEWTAARDNQKTWHFASDGAAIPCNCPTIDGAGYFWKYAMNTPFIHELFDRLEKNAQDWFNTWLNNCNKPNPQGPISDGQPESNGWKKVVKKIFPYGSPAYVSLKAIYFNLKNRPYDPMVDIINGKKFAKDNQKIKIFVSRRIDVDSAIINNPIFQDVRCGAVYDKPSPFLGDDTGDNISRLRMQFNEMTVMYYAWKNEDADYFGLCHYRRYPSFTSNNVVEGDMGCVVEDYLDRKTIKKYSLDDKRLYERKIPKADIWVSGTMNTDTMLSAKVYVKQQPNARILCVYDLFMCAVKNHLPTMPLVTLKLVQEMFPQYFEAAKDYLKGKRYYAYNCFVMKKSLFNQFCEFVFPVLFELNRRYNFQLSPGSHTRTPGYMSELLYGIFVHWAIQNGYVVKETPLVFIKDTRPHPERTLIGKLGDIFHRIRWKVSRQYRAIFRLDDRVFDIQRRTAQLDPVALSGGRSGRDSRSLTSNVNLEIACLANQIHEYHKAAFSEFKNCHTGGAVAIIASGPTAKYYRQIQRIPHIGMNASFTIPGIKLDFYFATDFENHPAWSDQLKRYDFIKFFGQYSTGVFQPKFQVSEQLIRENNGRRFFQSAPNEEIHYDIEYYPLIGFYTIALQALQFALYTNAKRIYLVGCDCTMSGYFNGTIQSDADINSWIKGYTKIKAFAEQFYPDTEIISINPVGLRGLFHDIYTENYLDDNPEINRSLCNTVDLGSLEKQPGGNL